MNGRYRVALLAALALTFTGVSTTSAQTSWGPRAGFSLSPDQFVVGFHAMIPVGSGLYVVPSGDVGFGDSSFTWSLNGDLQYRFSTSGSVKPFIGGGVTYFNLDPDTEGVDTFSEFGGGILGGVWLNTNGSTPFFLEGKVGLGDVPDFKFMAGLNL